MTPDSPEYGWVHDQADRTFRKTLPPSLADVEERGWRQVAHLLPVPQLLNRIDDADRCTLVYEDVFARGQCRRLLADAITAADADPTRTSEVARLINAVCDTWVHAAASTGCVAPLSECVSALYAHRLRPGGRLDAWYGTSRARTITTDHGTYRVHLPTILEELRGTLTADSQWPTAVTQGDPTEPNIADDELCWLDFEHAGRNAIAGDVAILLWYLLGMGGWLVPAYQPITYMRTLRIRGHGAVPPDISHLVSGFRAEVGFVFRARSGRRAALDALLQRIHGDVGAILAPPGMDPDAALKPWLAIRILGVIPLAGMSRADRAVCLATLAHVLDPRLGVRDITITSSPDLIRAA